MIKNDELITSAIKKAFKLQQPQTVKPIEELINNEDHDLDEEIEEDNEEDEEFIESSTTNIDWDVILNNALSTVDFDIMETSLKRHEILFNLIFGKEDEDNIKELFAVICVLCDKLTKPSNNDVFNISMDFTSDLIILFGYVNDSPIKKFATALKFAGMVERILKFLKVIDYLKTDHELEKNWNLRESNLVQSDVIDDAKDFFIKIAKNYDLQKMGNNNGNEINKKKKNNQKSKKKKNKKSKNKSSSLSNNDKVQNFDDDDINDFYLKKNMEFGEIVDACINHSTDFYNDTNGCQEIFEEYTSKIIQNVPFYNYSYYKDWVNLSLDSMHQELLWSICCVLTLSIYKLYDNPNLTENPFLMWFIRHWHYLTKTIRFGIIIDQIDEEIYGPGTPWQIRSTLRGASALRCTLATILNQSVQLRQHDLKHESLNNYMSPFGRKTGNGGLTIDIRYYVAILVVLGYDLNTIGEFFLELEINDGYDDDIFYIFEYEFSSEDDEDDEVNDNESEKDQDDSSHKSVYIKKEYTARCYCEYDDQQEEEEEFDSEDENNEIIKLKELEIKKCKEDINKFEKIIELNSSTPSIWNLKPALDLDKIPLSFTNLDNPNKMENYNLDRFRLDSANTFFNTQIDALKILSSEVLSFEKDPSLTKFINKKFEKEDTDEDDNEDEVEYLLDEDKLESSYEYFANPVELINMLNTMVYEKVEFAMQIKVVSTIKRLVISLTEIDIEKGMENLSNLWLKKDELIKIQKSNKNDEIIFENIISILLTKYKFDGIFNNNPDVILYSFRELILLYEYRPKLLRMITLVEPQLKTIDFINKILTDQPLPGLGIMARNGERLFLTDEEKRYLFNDFLNDIGDYLKQILDINNEMSLERAQKIVKLLIKMLKNLANGPQVNLIKNFNIELSKVIFPWIGSIQEARLFYFENIKSKNQDLNDKEEKLDKKKKEEVFSKEEKKIDLDQRSLTERLFEKNSKDSSTFFYIEVSSIIKEIQESSNSENTNTKPLISNINRFGNDWQRII